MQPAPCHVQPSGKRSLYRRPIPHFACCTLHFAFLLLSACSTYELRGRVIEGPTPAVVVLSADDPRFTRNADGLPGAIVEAVIDPDRPLQQITLDPQLTEDDGSFTIPVSATGAGVLEYTVQLTVRLAEHTSVRRSFKLPGRGKRVLVIIAPGPDGLPPDEPDILLETLHLGEQLNR